MNANTLPTPERRWPRAALLAALLALLASAAFATSASAAAPELLFQAPEGLTSGSGAGQLENPRGIAASPTTGHIYVSDLHNARIDEFTAWGNFVRAWGWDVSPDGAPGDTASDQLEVCTTVCQAGVEGSGAGQLHSGLGVTLDAAGDLYVYEFSGQRVQKFSPQGEFLAMFGGEVDKTTKANLCTKADLEAGDECGAGVPGTGPGEFSISSGGNYIAYDPATNTILVGDVGRIQEFNPDGTYKGEIEVPGETISGLAIDTAGNLYASYEGKDNVHKLDPAGAEVVSFPVSLPPNFPTISVAVDAAGNLYAAEPSGLSYRVLEFDAAGHQLLPTQAEEETGTSFSNDFPYIQSFRTEVIGLATNVIGPASTTPGDLYISFSDVRSEPNLGYLAAYGPSPIAFEPPPPADPQISAQYATSVGTNDASLRAEINPHFWTDATYYVQYGTGKCSEGGCINTEPLPPGSSLTAKSVNGSVKSAAVILAGLQPGTAYHYRFVSESSGGGPVYGGDPDGAGPGEADPAEGTEATFTTFPAATPPPSCPANEAFRIGPGAKLPDCRAYELVSPLDKSNGDALLTPGLFTDFNLSSRAGDRFTYSSATPFAEPESAPYVSQYLSSRDPSTGWRSAAISPPRSAPALALGPSLGKEFDGFTPDLCTAWLAHNSKSTLTPEAIAGYPNLYRRDNCGGAASYEALSTAEPPEQPAEEYFVNLMGYADQDPGKAIFLANDKLTEDAPELGDPGPGGGEKELQLYEHTAGGLHFICHLPNGAAWNGACAAGMAAEGPEGKGSSVQNAISADGSEVFWTAYEGTLETKPRGIPGQIYLRRNPEAEQSKVVGGKCSEPEAACTIAVSGSVTPGLAQFWGASDDGSKAIFKVVSAVGETNPLANNLYEFDVASRKSHLIAGGVEGPMGISEDASRVYFDSTKVLGEGASEGAKEGAHNLYLYQAPGEAGGEASFRFIMGLTGPDLHGSEGAPSAVNEVTSERSSAISADGLHAAFSSGAAPPSGYDNHDAQSGQADEEAYVYDASEEKLRCVSCNPTGARPAGALKDNSVWQAARLPNRRAPFNPLHPLAEDGKRLFFESHEALVPRDTNGTWDVYQWEASGEGSCKESDSTYTPTSEGCVDLISSGESAAPSRLLDADASGANVFIGTQSSLIGADFGSNDVYDARIGGGFPEPTGVAACEGEACQGPLAAPNDPTPASSSFEGAGNVNEGPKSSCAKPKVRRKGRCVAKKHAKRAKKAKHNRRAGR
jgi:hypothetical protein